jgi:para-nitrobenzyl esterase
MRKKDHQNQVFMKPGTLMRFLSLIAAALIITGCSSLSAKKTYIRGVSQHTQYGQVIGTTDEKTDNLVWRGIRFAKAPVGDLRWRAPEEPEKWQGVIETQQAPPQCIQGTGGKGEEDCLFLNIYRPNSEANNLPVYVWIHGGANKTGRAPDLNYFAKETNLVVVAIQYRLGPLGFINHDALRTGDPLEDSGNYGLLDQMAALKWVKNNIRLFGGDQNNVTIAGESAGAHDILALLTIEEANDLYHKALYQSGGMENIGLSQAKKLSAGYVEKLKLTSTGAELAKELRALDAKSLLKAVPRQWRFGVINDGNLLKGDLLCLVKQGEYNKVPIFMGGNRNEYSAWLLWYQGPKGKWAKLWKTLPKGGNKEVSDILNEEEQKTFALTSSLTSRLWQAQLVHSVARFMRQYQDNVFVYNFQWGGTKGSKVDFVLGASHANEIGYFHYGGEWDWMGQQTSITEENKAARHALAKAMLTYQAQFAYLGTPNGEAELPEWKAWSNEENGVKAMNLDASSEPGSAELKLYMTKREYIQADLIREMEESNDEIAQKFTKMIAKWKLVKLECE